MKWTTRSLWWRGPLLRGLDRLQRWHIRRFCPLNKHSPNVENQDFSRLRENILHFLVGILMSFAFLFSSGTRPFGLGIHPWTVRISA